MTSLRALLAFPVLSLLPVSLYPRTHSGCKWIGPHACPGKKGKVFVTGRQLSPRHKIGPQLKTMLLRQGLVLVGFPFLPILCIVFYFYGFRQVTSHLYAFTDSSKLSPIPCALQRDKKTSLPCIVGRE